MNPTRDHQAEAQAMARPQARALSCDEVAWLKHALERFEAVCASHGRHTRTVNTAKMAALLEIMEITGCSFLDDAARHNAICDFPELYQGERSSVPKAMLRGADAEAYADRPFANVVATVNGAVTGSAAVPSPSPAGAAEPPGSGAAAHAEPSEGRTPVEADAAPARSKKPRKPRKAKAKRKEKKVSGTRGQGPGEPAATVQTEMPAPEPVLEEAA